jgi:hypothetical protein
MPVMGKENKVKKDRTNDDILKELLNPLQQNALKTVQKIQKEQIEEAMQQGVPPEHILQQLGVEVQTPSVQMGKMEDTKETTPPKSASLNVQKPKGLLQNLLGQSGVQTDQQGQLTGVKQGGFFDFNVGPTNTLIKQLMDVAQMKNQNPEEMSSLIAQRKANTALMEQMARDRAEGKDADTIYRDPVTGEEVDPIQAQEDMEKGLGVYQVNQKLYTRSGVKETNLNKVPDLTQEEKKYVNDARMIGKSLNNLETGFDKLYGKFGKANWQAFQMEKVPYLLAQDQDVQDLKSELVYMKAAIPFMRGGKQLTPMEAKRIDVMLNPFGKNKETFKKDINRFENEFLGGTEVTKFGINAPLMKRLIKTDRKKTQQTQEQTGSSQTFNVGGKMYNIPADKVEAFKKAKGIQ